MLAAIEASAEIIVPARLQRESIYTIILSRFYDGNSDNNYYNRENIDGNDPHWRGDLQGAASRLAYIKSLGFTAVCISPPCENRGGLDYLGFNTYDWYKIDPRLTSPHFGYQDFIDAAHSFGLKVIQTIVLNHSCNYGIRNYFFIPRLPLKFYRGPIQPVWPYIFNLGNHKHPFRMDNDNPCAPEWFKDFLIHDPWGAGPLTDPITGKVFPQENQHPERFFGTDEKHLDPQWYHRSGWLQNPSSIVISEVQNQHLGQNEIDLATDRWHVKNFFKDIGIHYINKRVDGFRIQFARNIARDDLRHIIETWKQRRPDLMVIADVEPVQQGYGSLYKETEPSELVPWWFTRTTQYPLKPDLGEDSGIAVFDYGLFKSFAGNLTQGHFSGIGSIISKDWAYGNPLTLVNFFHNFTSGPEEGNLTRFLGEEWQAACAYNLIWTIRGVPCLLQGEEIAFQRGMPQIIVTPQDRLAQTGHAYFGGNLENDSINESLSHNLARHIARLNQIRGSIDALTEGNLENGREFVSGMSFVRNFNNGESYAVIGLSAFVEQEITVERVLPGEYTDAITGETQLVATSTRSITFSVKDNSAGIWVRNGPGKIGNDGPYLR